MPIPKSIVELLKNVDIRYQTIQLPEPLNIQKKARYMGEDAANLVRVVAFETPAKKVVAVLPYQSLLDTKNISEHLQGTYNVMNSEQMVNCFDGISDISFPPVPGFSGIHLVIDTSVLDLPEVIMQSGDPEILIKLDKINANLLFQECESYSFAASQKDFYVGRSVNSEKGELDSSFTAIRLKQRIDETFDLPAMPEIARDIMALRVDPGADANRLAQIVCRDPSLAAQVISWASSPYYGYQGTVDSVETAIARVLGFELVMNLALGISIGKSLMASPEGPLGVREFWKQAIYTANLAERLCCAMPIKQRPERGLIYLSGLLHNFGHLLLGHIFPPQFKLLNETVEANPHIAVEDIEIYILGVTHQEIGAWLMKNWHMPAQPL